ncbi:unnamed protein product [Gongylonema pulchrum]|uniref:Lipoprotein n=1 Tax=Gongylonema pulchrum TaxID=637853 RepID=A0A183E0U1_9BILA|nr:unnamed protein product [Gongylonema pulchrum]
MKLVSIAACLFIISIDGLIFRQRNIKINTDKYSKTCAVVAVVAAVTGTVCSTVAGVARGVAAAVRGEMNHIANAVIVMARWS